MAEPSRYDLFVSYANADRTWVEGYLFDALRKAGVRYHSEAAFALGVPRLLEFERAIKQSQRRFIGVMREDCKPRLGIRAVLPRYDRRGRVRAVLARLVAQIRQPPDTERTKA